MQNFIRAILLNQFEIFCNSRWIHGYNLGLSTSIRSNLSQQIFCKVMCRSIGGSLQILTYSWVCHSIICIGRVVDLGPRWYLNCIDVLRLHKSYGHIETGVSRRFEAFFLAATDTGLMISGLV